MAIGYHQVLDASFASGSTFSTEVYMGGFHRVAIELPAFTACLATESACVYVNVANTQGGTYRRVKDQGVYSAASGIYDWEVPQGIGNCTVVCRALEGFNWVKLETARGATFNATCTAGMAAKILVGE